MSNPVSPRQSNAHLLDSIKEPTGRWESDSALIHWRISQLEAEREDEKESREKLRGTIEELNVNVSNLRVRYSFIGVIAGVAGGVVSHFTAMFGIGGHH